MRTLLVVSLSCLAWLAAALADGPADNKPENVRRVPKVGIEVSRRRPQGARRWAGEAGRGDRAAPGEEGRRRSRGLLPDVQVFHKAVHDALKYQEFFDPKDIAKAKHQLEEGIASGRGPAQGGGPLGVADRPGGPGLRLEDRRLGPALRAGRPADLHDHHPAPLPARHLVPGAGRDRQRGQLHRHPRAQRGHLHAGRHDRPAPLRAVLQRLQVRRRGRRPGGARGRQAEVQGRRGPDQRPGVLDGGRGGLAVRRALLGPVVRRQPGRRVRGDAPVPQRLPEREARADLVREGALASLRLHRLRRQPAPVPDRRLQRRARHARSRPPT